MHDRFHVDEDPPADFEDTTGYTVEQVVASKSASRSSSTWNESCVTTRSVVCSASSSAVPLPTAVQAPSARVAAAVVARARVIDVFMCPPQVQGGVRGTDTCPGEVSRLPSPVLTGAGSRVCGRSRTLSTEVLPCRNTDHATPSAGAPGPPAPLVQDAHPDAGTDRWTGRAVRYGRPEIVGRWDRALARAALACGSARDTGALGLDQAVSRTE